MLVRAGANVKAANRYGITPMYSAAINGNASMIQLLIEAGADVNAALPEGETALMTAARTGKVDAMKVLLEHGADVNVREKWKNQTALMWAAHEGNAERRSPIDRCSAGRLCCLPRARARATSSRNSWPLAPTSTRSCPTARARSSRPSRV
jgi:hypothetical protein